VFAAVVAVAATACSSGGAREGGASSVAASTTTTVAPDCAPNRPAPAALPAYTFRYGSHDRSYLLSLPHDYDGRSAHPLVLDFAGFAGTKESQEAFTQMGAKATARGFVVVTPDALGNPRQWNEFGFANQADDFGFVDALVADLEHRLCIDPDRVYASGHSNGSAFAGTADSSVPYAGGLVAGSTIPIPSARTTIAFYAQRYSCARTPRQTRPSAGVTQISYSGCTGGGEVRLDTVAGGTHTWPGGPAAADSHDSAAGKLFRATDQILDFFARHRRSPSR
jgi:polyhydroxybutyrate depolymerase